MNPVTVTDNNDGLLIDDVSQDTVTVTNDNPTNRRLGNIIRPRQNYQDRRSSQHDSPVDVPSMRTPTVSSRTVTNIDDELAVLSAQAEKDKLLIQIKQQRLRCEN